MANAISDSATAATKASEPRPELARRHPRSKKSTKEKIDKLVADGAKNYPAYLKLIYTGDSELSSEDEFNCADNNKAKLNTSKVLISSSVTRESEAAPSTKTAAALMSPESTKLMDPGREKLPTPVDQCLESETVVNKSTGTCGVYGKKKTNVFRPTLLDCVFHI